MPRATRFGLASLALLVPLFAVATAAPAFGRVIVVQVAQTDDPAIGKDCRIDLENIRGVFNRHPAMARLTEFITIEGRNANHETITARLRGLQVGPDDSVMFYYSGYGAKEPGSKESYCLLPNNRPLYLSQVSRMIAAKNPRLNIVIADTNQVSQAIAGEDPPPDIGDADAGDPIRQPPRTAAPAPRRETPPNDIPPALRSLFLESRGAAIVTGCGDGQVAVADVNNVEGGIFTFAFAEAIHGKINQNPTWREVFDDAARRTREKFVLDNPNGIADIPGIGEQRTQTPKIITFRITPGDDPSDDEGDAAPLDDPAVRMPPPLNGGPARVHALLVGVSGSGPTGVDRDLDRAQDALARGLGERASLKILQNRDATRDAILGYYRGLKIAPDDTLLFYYSGPAAGALPSEHRLTPPGSAPLKRDELRTEMMRLNPRLIVILTECVGPRAAPETVDEAIAAAPPEEMKARYQRLLFEHQGTVDVNSAALDPRAGDQASWGDASSGGVFSAAFDYVLRNGETPAAKFAWSHVEPRPDDALVLLADRVEANYRALKNDLLKNPSRLGADDLERLRAQKTQRPQVISRQVREVERSPDPAATTRGGWRGGMTVAASPRLGGVRVEAVARGSAAEARGFEVGDVIVSIDGAATETPDKFHAALDRVVPGGTARLTIRDPKDRTILEYVDLRLDP